MYIDVAYAEPNQVAHMVTPEIMSVSEPYCITFWLYISEPKTGLLTVSYHVVIPKLKSHNSSFCFPGAILESLSLKFPFFVSTIK